MNANVLLLLASFLSLSSFTLAPNEATALSLAADHIRKANPTSVTLRIANSADYIAGDPNNISIDEEQGNYNVVGEFKKYVKATDGVDITVTYDTFSTMEDMLSKAQTGGNTYDLVCVSDYIIQKMMSLNMVVPFASGEERAKLYGDRATGWEDNYSLYASKYLQNSLKAISAKVNGTPASLGDYARGYMWGTLGVTYNPNFAAYAERGLSEGDVMVQMSDWNALWSKSYSQTFQVKDSMRDTYSIGLMHVFDSYFKTLMGWYEAGVDNAGNAYGAAEYNADVSTIFNNINHLEAFNTLVKKINPEATSFTEADIVDSVQTSLSDLKASSFGLEVDSGKTDILDKSGIDTAWSGDAVTSMDSGDALANPVTLYYSIPKTGGNIWFDAWVLMKSDSLNQEYAQKFIDFISDPTVASPNMDYIGYTSFIAGDSILELVRDWYDPRTSAMYVYDTPNSDYLYDEDGNKVFKDGTGIHTDTSLDYGALDMTGSTYAAPVIASDSETTSWDAYWQKYNTKDDNDWVKVDLSYFFEGSLSEYTAEDMVFYSSELVEATGKDLDGKEQTVLVGRQFLAQYPTKDEAEKATILDQIPSLAVMEDYGDNNSYVLRMWENVKSGGSIQPWIIVVLCVEAVLALGFGIYVFSKNSVSKKLRKKRREEREDEVKD